MRLTLKRRPKPAAVPARRPAPPANVPLPDYEPVDSADPLAEIDELMAANRPTPDAATEKRIVQLRHEAFAQLDRDEAPRSPVLSDAVVGELPSPDGLPEIHGLRADQRAPIRDGILGGGSLLIRGLLDPERAERMRDGHRRDLRRPRRAAWRTATLTETAPWFDPFAPGPDYPLDAAQWNRMKKGGHAVWAPDSPRMMFELLDAFEVSGLSDTISDYLGERPALSMNKSVLRRVSPESGTDWHQDGAFLGRGIRTCNVWIALTRCGDIAPGLDIVARRYDEIVETGTEGAMFPWAVSPQKVEESRGGAEVARPIFEPGDAILFDHFCLHRTGGRAGDDRGPVRDRDLVLRALGLPRQDGSARPLARSRPVAARAPGHPAATDRMDGFKQRLSRRIGRRRSDRARAGAAGDRPGAAARRLRRRRRAALRRRRARAADRLDVGLAPLRQHLAAAPARLAAVPRARRRRRSSAPPAPSATPAALTTRCPVDESFISNHLSPAFGDPREVDGAYVPGTINNYLGDRPVYAYSKAYREVWAPEARRFALVRLLRVPRAGPGRRRRRRRRTRCWSSRRSTARTPPIW